MDNNVSFSEENLRKLIHNYDRDRDFAININEFLNITVPRKSQELRSVVLERKNYDKDSISREVEHILLKLIQKELQIVEDLANLAEELKNSKDFTTYEAFISVDLHQSKYITYHSLENFLKKNGYNLNQGEVDDILFRLDNDGDGRVSYEEFQEIFFPLKAKGTISFVSSGNNYHHNSTFYQTGSNFNRHEEQFGREDNFKSTINKSFSGSNANFFRGSPSPNKNSDNLVKTNEKFWSTVSTINKVGMSPLRSTIHDDINLKASLNTYTSPNRFRNNEHSSPIHERVNKSLYQTRDRFIDRSDHYNNLDSSRRYYSPIRQNRTASYISPLKTRSNYSSLSPLNTRANLFSTVNSLSPNRYYQRVNNEKVKAIHLAKFLNDLLYYDVETEAYRETLALKSDVNLENLFISFDYTGRNSISLVDFKEVLKEDLRIFVTLNELKLVFKRYDVDMDGRLEYKFLI